MKLIKKLWDWAWGVYYAKREVWDYLIFGVLATILNFVLLFAFGAMGMATWLANLLANALCILFAYVTNHIWVFHSHAKGAELWQEFVKFVSCRIGTMVMDEAVVVLGADVIGPRIGLADNSIWLFFVKLFAQVLVVVGNYVFSKLFIFKNKEGKSSAEDVSADAAPSEESKA